MATIDATTSVETPSRRALLAGAAAALSTGAVVQPARGAGATAVSPEVAAAIADYWTRVAEANAPGARDELIDAKCDEIEDAAARIAAAPCRGVADLAAKVTFFVALMNYQNVWGSITSAEGDVLVSVEADVLALAGRAA